MKSDTIYKPSYENSLALVIGINKYELTSPLGFARQDAEGFAHALISIFGFPVTNVIRLLDGEASRENILSSFLRFAEPGVGPDDRIAVFFAGHGYTRRGRRGEVGYLVPVDGNPDELSSLLRWDDLTRNAELIQAKHLLFVMDACYGGLAIHRSIPSGGSRFCRDMLQRYSRQVLTAGKADETVADSGGPRPNHSIFTGHLLDALEGKAADANGIISANAVMAYVYARVSKDPHSAQSPHFGFLDGDGDFIFAHPPLSGSDPGTKEQNRDFLMSVPPFESPDEPLQSQSLADEVKGYLSEPRYRIRLDDLVSHEVRAALGELRGELFSVQAGVTIEQFAERLKAYEKAVSRLNVISILIARWGTHDQQPLLERIIGRLADANESRGGSTVWIGLRWYPILYLMYSAGISALSSRNYPNLMSIVNATVGSSSSGRGNRNALRLAVEGTLDVDRAEMFKRLPGYDRYHVPRSEYLFKALQPELEDLLFLGNSYEDLFDRFEIFYALLYADLEMQRGGRVWGPPGRFGWKRGDGSAENPFVALVEEAERYGNSWDPLKAGLFSGSGERFRELATTYKAELLDRLQWF